MFLAFSENLSIFSHEIFYRHSWYNSHHFFFSNHLEGDDSVLAGHFGEFFGYFFHEILYRYSRYYSGVRTPKRFFTWSCALLLLRVICGMSSISWELFIISLNFKQPWHLLNLNVFSHHVPLCWGPFGGRYFGFILGMFFHVLWKSQYFLVIFCAEPLFNALMVTKQKIMVEHLLVWDISSQFRSVFLKHNVTI